MATTLSAGHHRMMHSESRAPVERVIVRLIEWVTGVVEAFIAIRFVLELFGANAAAGFVQFVYDVSDVFMAPFVAIFNTTRASGATLEWSALVAMAVYALIAWGVIALIGAISPRENVQNVESTVQDESNVVPPTARRM